MTNTQPGGVATRCSCGILNPPGACFCNQCGKRLNASPSAPLRRNDWMAVGVLIIIILAFTGGVTWFAQAPVTNMIYPPASEAPRPGTRASGEQHQPWVGPVGPGREKVVDISDED